MTRCKVADDSCEIIVTLTLAPGIDVTQTDYTWYILNKNEMPDGEMTRRVISKASDTTA